jgi:hypothetical protein
MKKLKHNPIHLYTGVPCIICDTDEPVSDKIEGCDYVQDKIIAERTDWDPDIIKPVLRHISDITPEEALHVANLAWFPANKIPIGEIELKTTPIFPFAAVYFDWGPFDFWEGEDEYKNSYVLSLDNDHHTIKLFAIDKTKNDKLIPMQVYQSHKITAYLISRGFHLGILEEGSYIIRNTR